MSENALPQTENSADGVGMELPSEEKIDISPPVKRGRPTNAEREARAARAGIKPEKPGAPKSAAEKPQKRGAKMSAEAVSTLAKQIQGMHAMAAMMTGMGILQISDGEAALLAGGISAVAEEYGLALDGKTGAALQLFGAAAMVYAPRIIAIQKAKAAARDNTVDATIVQ